MKGRKKPELKSMPRCDVKLNSCRDLIRKLTKGNTGNDGNLVQEKVIGLNKTIEDQLLQMQDISEDEDDLLAGHESALMSGDISD